MDRKEKLRRILGGSLPLETTPRDPARRRAEEVAAGFEIHHDSVALSSMYGEVSLNDAVPISPHVCQMAGLAVSEFPATPRILFLDTETTGLAGGTGTYIFLMGLATLVPGSRELSITQFFLPGPALEDGWLEPIVAAIEDSDLIVCFNGKSYDLPLLETRLLLQGRPGLPAEKKVLDLLYPARRYWRTLIGSCNLGNLEREVFRFYRRDDIPGCMIPDIYFRYLRTGDFHPVRQVLEHNRLDLIAMAALLSALNRRLPPDEAMDPHSLFCLMRSIRQKGSGEDFESLLSSQGSRLEEAAGRHAGAGRVLADLLKSSGRRVESYRLYLHLSVVRPLEYPETMEEVLIHEEHHDRDYQRALVHCDQFLEIIARRPDLDWLRERLQHRRSRLRQKLEKKAR